MIKEKKYEVSIQGLTPLIMDKLSTEIVTIHVDPLPPPKIDDKLYFTKDGHIGFPAAGFMKGMIEVAPQFDELTRTKVRGSIRVLGDIVPIKYKDKIVHKAACTIPHTKKPLKRPELTEWSCVLDIMYDANVISKEQIINLLNRAGSHYGLGSLRPSCGGEYGQYKVKET